jgi:hypothetical protein
MDDFKGWFCNLNAFPIIESIKEEFEHKFVLVDVDKNSTTHHIRETTKRIHELKTASDRPFKLKTGSTDKTHMTNIKDKPKDLMGINENGQESKKVDHENTEAKNGVASNKEVINVSNVDEDKALNKTPSNEEPRNEPNLDSVVRSVKKKFKAVREIRLSACLNKKLCKLGFNSSSKVNFSWQKQILIIFGLFRFLIILS